ncbi:MAG: UDP-N-acetylmuramate dehydrogenase [Bacteroidales bacterium]|nr:UDP-N-acetylmuramate dehydrogenase [Bacteroidales bacterium]
MILKNVALKPYNTFGLDYKAAWVATIANENEAVSLCRDIHTFPSPLLLLGEGSNILFTGDFSGTVIRVNIDDITVEEKEGDDVIVSAGSGLRWDTFVEWCVNHGFYGLENLSLIPGTVGAAPVQNIGAYGTEVSETVTSVRTIDIKTGQIREFSSEECNFGYRTSVFKTSLKGRYLVLRVSFRLSRSFSPRTGYGNLAEELEATGRYGPADVRKAVIAIRRRKLPDPLVTGNAGSFFKNPVIDNIKASEMLSKNPGMPSFRDPSGNTKLAAGWLIEQCGWKGKRIGDAGVHDKQALVIVNYGNATGMELFELSEKIRNSVYERFGIDLEREVEVV